MYYDYKYRRNIHKIYHVSDFDHIVIIFLSDDRLILWGTIADILNKIKPITTNDREALFMYSIWETENSGEAAKIYNSSTK